MSVDILICNLTRLGDLLETQPLINDLNDAGYSVGLVCQQNFANALPLLRNVKQSWTLPGAKFLSELDKSWPQAVNQVLDFTRKVNEEARAKYIINLTPSLPARLIARLLAKNASLLGFGIDEEGYAQNEGIWSSFISVASRQRINAPFNIADMLRRLAQPLTGKGKGDFLLESPDEKALKWADNFLENYRDKGKAFVAFQPGASSESRRWPIEYFTKLGQYLWDKERIIPVLLGAPNENELAEKYGKNANHPWVNAIGKTDLQQAAALLKNCVLIVSNDTGTMHLASGQNVPVLAFFLATAQPWDTSPLKPDSCCLEPLIDCHPCAFNIDCPHKNCLSVISPESAGDLVSGWLKTGNWSYGVTAKVNSECRVWLTGKDKDGLTSLELLSKGQEEERSLWLPHLRNFWRQLLDSIENPTAQEESDVNLPVPAKIAKEAVPVLLQTSEILESIYTCAEIMTKNPQAGKLFLKNISRLQGLLDSSPPLATLAAFWQDFRINQGNDLKSFIPAIKKLAGHTKNFAMALSRPANA